MSDNILASFLDSYWDLTDDPIKFEFFYEDSSISHREFNYSISGEVKPRGIEMCENILEWIEQDLYKFCPCFDELKKFKNTRSGRRKFSHTYSTSWDDFEGRGINVYGFKIWQAEKVLLDLRAVSGVVNEDYLQV